MVKISPEEVTWIHPHPENVAWYPSSISIGDKLRIENGMTVESEGSEGVVCDLDMIDAPDFGVKIFWFSGPLASDKNMRMWHYTSDQFLAFFGLEWKEEDKS